MSGQERQGWIIVAGLFVTLLLIFGSGVHTSGVFITPLLKSGGAARKFQACPLCLRFR
jgi:hypothetical protein